MLELPTIGSLKSEEPNEAYLVLHDQYESKKGALERAISQITERIVAITKRHLSSIEIDVNPEVTIANILAALPPPEEVIIPKVYHTMNQG